MGSRIDISGLRFGRLVAIKLATCQPRTMWLCLCDCGNEKVINTSALRAGFTRSCGCLQKEVVAAQGRLARKHGGGRSPEYRSYSMMRARCLIPTFKQFNDYGGRGIKICDRWLQGFQYFLEDMGPRPENHTLDRIDVNGGYSPENCRWATLSQQARNTRATPYETIDGVTKTRFEWIQESRWERSTIYKRLQRGIPFEQAIA